MSLEFDNRIYEFMLVRAHNLQFVPIVEVAHSIGLLKVQKGGSGIVDEHRFTCIHMEALMNSIIKYDGQRYDLRVNFVGLADSALASGPP